MTLSDTISKYKAHESAHVRNRATIILMTLEGESSEDIAEKVGLTLATVKKWQAAWESNGADIFPQMENKAISAEPLQADEYVNGTDTLEVDADVDAIIESSATKEPYLHNLVFPEIAAIEVTNSMAEASRVIMLKQLQAMLEQEPIARAGEDIEGVHQMRVATRRWRSAYDTFGDYLPKSYQKGIQKDLRQTARRLGKVRDLDVFWLKTSDYAKTENTDLQPLIHILEKDKQDAQKKLFQWLDNKQFKRLVKRAFKLLTQPISGETLIVRSGEFSSARLDHVLPAMIYQRFEAVRRYEELLSDAPIETLHSLRKDCKRFRYILEMFSDILGKEVQQVIAATKIIQDHLGDMTDAEVATNIIRAAEKQVKKSERPALKAYRKSRQAEIAQLRDNFSEVWSAFNQAEIRYALAQSVAVL